LSKLETAFFYLWEWHPHIIDIREQYPLLPLSATQAIADRLRIRHPAFRGIPVVMTTDVVVTIERNDRLIEVAITIKYAKDLGNKRTLEKLEIERVFWRDLSIPWLIVVDRDLPTALARNLEHLHPFHLRSFHPTDFETLRNHSLGHYTPCQSFSEKFCK